MEKHSLLPIIVQHPFFTGLDQAYLELIAGCAKNAAFRKGETIFREGQQADWFYLVREGQVVLDIAMPPRGKVTIQTLEAGEVLGWAWLFPPYKWAFGATAASATRAIALDGACLRQKCEADPKLGYDLMKRFARVMMERMQAARIQMLDIYGAHGSARG
jgi:CRP-like cAMP-binding protein